MNPRLTTVFGAVIGLLWIAAMAVLWQHDRAERSRSSAIRIARPASAAPVVSRPAAPVPPRAPDSFSDPAVRKLITALAELLIRSDVRPDEAVLSFKDDAALARFLERAQKAGMTVLDRLDSLHTVRVHYGDIGDFQNELAQNAADYADLSGNYLFSVPQIPAKENRTPVDEIPFGNNALPFIGATGDRTQWGRGVTIAILDTGVGSDATFGAGRLSAIDIGYGIAPGKATDDGHGTSVASLAAGMATDAPGVAPAANLLSIRVTDPNSTSDIFAISRAIVTAVDSGARVINVSLGGYGTNLALQNAIGYANDHGAVIVAAAGNDQAAQLAWPAADTRVVSVGAVDRSGQQVSFSNSGPQLQLTAPGYGVQTAWLNGDRASVDGTSASAPIVSGAIAALMSQNPSLAAGDAAALLDKTANDAGAPGADPAYGNGILNLGWAMNANNPAYIDTAVSSHYYDAANGQMEFVVQNRSGQAVTGLTFVLNSGSTNANFPIENLPPGGTKVISVPVDASQLNTAGQIRFSTTLINPAGVMDQVPSNNRRSSVLTAPKG
jgi:hypothetical protein